MTNSTRLTESVESYKHRFAKTVLSGWLRDATKEQGLTSKCVQLWDFAWTPNRGDPSYGVYEEFPITDAVLTSGRWVQTWDEVRLDSHIPTFEELLSSGDCPHAILDIAIAHKGVITYGFEVVHKSPVSNKKAVFLWGLKYLEVYVISADWILSQVHRPAQLKYTQKIGGLL